MKILHINNYDILGGASLACLSINKALHSIGVTSEILTQSKLSNLDFVFEYEPNSLAKLCTNARILLDAAAIRFLTDRSKGRFSFPYIGVDISSHKKVKEADIIHLHWVNGGFFSLNTFKKLKELNKPIVWTFHDMWGFTGGCHYTGKCNNYLSECNNCPALKTGYINKFANKIYLGKKQIFNDFDFFIVTCSNWLANETKSSSLLKNKNTVVIPNPIDVETFKDFDKKESRKILGLSENKKYILFGTMTISDKRKGYHFLLRALKKFANFIVKEKDDYEILIFGSEKNVTLNEIPFKINSFGRLSDPQKLARLYNAADIFIAPSLEDNLPNTVMEALSSGTPVAAFNIGGMPDMIDHKQNGYLALPESIDDLADGIIWLFNQNNRLIELGKNARQKVLSNFTYDIVAKKYLNLYKSILG